MPFHFFSQGSTASHGVALFFEDNKTTIVFSIPDRTQGGNHLNQIVVLVIVLVMDAPNSYPGPLRTDRVLKAMYPA